MNSIFIIHTGEYESRYIDSVHATLEHAKENAPKNEGPSYAQHTHSWEEEDLARLDEELVRGWTCKERVRTTSPFEDYSFSCSTTIDEWRVLA